MKIKKGGDSGAVNATTNVITGLIESLSSLLEKLITFISNNNESVFYHFIFFLSYILCFSYLLNTDNSTIQYLILIFIGFLHVTFLFIVLTANINVPSINKETNIVLYSPYLFGIGWLCIMISLSFIYQAYYTLYNKYTKNNSSGNTYNIDFGSLDTKKQNYLNNLYLSCIWMCIFYIFERIKILFLDFFTYNQVINTFILIFGMIFIGLSTYSIYLSYEITDSISKISLPPFNSFQSFFDYFNNLGGIDSEYKGYREGFNTTPSIDLKNIFPDKLKDISLNQLVNDDTHFEDISPEEAMAKPSVNKMLDKMGLASTTYEFSSNGLSINEYCSKSIEYDNETFILNKNNKDVYHIITNLSYIDIYGKSNNIGIGNVNPFIDLKYSMISILPRSNEYKNVSFNNNIPMENCENSYFLLDNATNIYQIQNKNTKSNKVEVTIYPITNSNYQNTNITTALGAGGIGTYLLTPKNDLVFIKTQFTTTKYVEIYQLDINSKYQKISLGTATPFLLDGVHPCTWSAELNRDNPVDKQFMDILEIKDQSSNLIGGIGTYLFAKNKDLYFIKTVDTQSKMVEIHGLSAESNYQKFCLHAITSLRLLYLSNNSTKPIGNRWATFGLGTFSLDSNDNLVYIKPIETDKNGNASSFSVFTLSAAKKYKKFIP